MDPERKLSVRDKSVQAAHNPDVYLSKVDAPIRLDLGQRGVGAVERLGLRRSQARGIHHTLRDLTEMQNLSKNSEELRGEIDG